MICPSCNHDNRSGAKFCEECAAPLKRACTGCGSELRPAAKFCDECGTKTDGGARPAPAPSEAPKHLAEKIRQSKATVEGERKQVTVLFADVKGSMELAESLDPEAFSKIMSRFFAILTEGVERFEGFVDKFTGDGIMALFGAPIAHEDHAQRACYAALHLKDEIARYATELKREHGLSFSTRMGLNSGEVVVGSISEDLRMDYTAQGHTVGLAQRMESLAEPNSCFVSANTAALARGYFDLEDLGEFRVKGVANPMHVHRLNGMGTSRTRFDVSRSRGLSRFVGRASDLRTLEDALEQTASGNGQVIGVVAEAGTGKSRLCFEFLERCRAKGMQVFEGRAVAHGRNIPFLPILDVFRSYFGITSEDNDNAARVKIAGHMMVLDQKFADTLPLVYDFLGVADPQNPAPRLDPEVRQRQLIGVIRQIIRSASEKTPTVTMVEDLHWLDAASAEFLEHMVDARAGTHSLLLLNFRPEYRAEWMQKSWYRQIPLTPLDERATAELLTSLLGSHQSIASLAVPIHQRTGGNPFFIEEVVQNLIETKHVEGSAGSHRFVTALDRLEVPATVKSILASRIDRLAEREKRLLQTASVIGKDFPETLLAEIAGLPVDELKSAIATLRRAEFIYELSLYPSVEYAFKHPLTQEVALASLLTERKRKIHRTLAEAIERQYPDHLDERAPLLAHHWEEAGEALAAARWHTRAANGVGRNDIIAAGYHWVRVRDLLRSSPDDNDATRMGLTACINLLGVAWRAGFALDEINSLLQDGQAFADLLGDPRAGLAVGLTYSRALAAVGDNRRYVTLAAENLRASENIGDLELQAYAHGFLAEALYFTGSFHESLSTADAGLALCKAGSVFELVLNIGPADAYLEFYPALCLYRMGRAIEARTRHDRCQQNYQVAGMIEIVGYVHSFAAEACYRAHDAEGALDRATQIEEINRKLGDPPVLTSHASMAMAYAHLSSGRPGDAIDPARNACVLHERVEKQLAGMSATLLAAALLESGDLSAAESAAETAIVHCERLMWGASEVEAHGILARVLLRREGAAASKRVTIELNIAASLLKKTGAIEMSPHLLEWRAELAAVLGDEASRTSLLNRAIDGFESIGAPLQAERLRKEMAT